jgi:hypothetical protein
MPHYYGVFNFGLVSTPSQLPRTLETQDDFVQLKAAQILTVLLWFVDMLTFRLLY